MNDDTASEPTLDLDGNLGEPKPPARRPRTTRRRTAKGSSADAKTSEAAPDEAGSQDAGGSTDVAGGESTPVEEDPQATISDAPGRDNFYFLTNRFNLVTCLGARLIQPFEAYRKYYPDLLQLVPGAVPLLLEPPNAELIREAVGKAPNSFPVLIEIRDVDGLVVDTTNQGLALVSGAIPWRRVRKVHVPSDRALKEHVARPYGNVHAEDDMLEVSPELFSGSTAQVSWPAQNQAVLGTDWDQIDRARGALNGIRAAGQTLDSLATLARVLEEAQTPAGNLTAAGWLRHAFFPPHTGTPDDPKTPPTAARGSAVVAGLDELLYTVTMSVLTRIDVQDDWSPGGVLQQITQNATEEASGRAKSVIAGNMEHIRQVISGERDFVPFKATGSGLAAAKALLMVLLRDDLTSLLSWPHAETAADDLTVQTAAAYAGALRGLSREAVGIRSRAFDDFTAELMTGVSDLERYPVKLVDTEDGLLLQIGDDVVQAAAAEQPDLRHLLNALDDDRKLEAQLRVCREMGWTDLVLTTVTWPAGYATNVVDGQATTQGASALIRIEVDPKSFEDRIAASEIPSSLIDMVLTGE